MRHGRDRDAESVPVRFVRGDAMKLTSRRIWRNRWLPFGVLVVGLAFTGLVVSALRSSTEQRTDDRRDTELDVVSAAIDARMRTYVQGLAGIRAMVESSPEFDARIFEQFVESQGLLTDLPGLQALGWNRLVSPSEVSNYEQEMRARHDFLPADFSVGPIEGARDLMVVELLQPVAGNEGAFGFNIASDPTRAQAIRMARATGNAAATGPVDLVQDEDSVPGILVLMDTTADDGTDGLAVAVFRTNDLLDSTRNEVGRGFVVHDIGGVGLPGSEPTILLSPRGTLDRAHQKEIDVFGRRWLITLEEDAATSAPSTGLVIGGASGVALAVVLAALIASVQRTATTAAREAHLLNQELSRANDDLSVLGSRLERGIRSADVVVWEHNATTGVKWSSANANHDDAGVDRHFLDRVHPDDLDEILSTPEPGPGQTRVQQFRLADKHGRYRTVLSRSVGMTRAGEWVVIGAHIDISDQQAHVDLIEQLNQDLTERNQALRDFTHVASHDLRSPLRAVNSLVSFLREDLPPDARQLAEPHLRRIDERVARMGQLIEDLMVYARAHSRDSNVESFAVTDVVHDVLATIDVPASMTFTVDCDVPTVCLAKTPFTMCLRNLVDNATKHHDKTDGHVAITAWMGDDELVLAVSDDGPGIDPEYLPKIFEPFRRLSVSDETPGSGIGLSVIERSTAVHGGSIDVQSDGRGSTFTIRWPTEVSDRDQSSSEVAPLSQ